MKYADLVNVDEMVRLKAEHYITSRSHPRLDLDILNYTPKTAYGRYWTDETEMCRGLIVNRRTKDVVARPFRKFFNLGEVPGQAIPAEPFVAYEKMDGSLGISYLDWDGLPSVATRGSFLSDQAKRATAVLRTKYADTLGRLADLCGVYTFCFEIILPENRIVIDYGDRTDLVLLAVFLTEDGSELRDETVAALGLPFPRPRTWAYDNLEDLAFAIDGAEFDGHEGVVVCFESGFRLKIKRADYMRMHRIVTGITPRRIWEMLKDGAPPVDRLFSGTPEGFQAWARERINDIEGEYRGVELGANSDYQQVMLAEPPDRKAFAMAAGLSPYASILFKMYDRQPYGEIIWKRIKPGASDPFRSADE